MLLALAMPLSLALALIKRFGYADTRLLMYKDRPFLVSMGMWED
jgi:hypothetical protein